MKKPSCLVAGFRHGLVVGFGLYHLKHDKHPVLAWGNTNLHWQSSLNNPIEHVIEEECISSPQTDPLDAGKTP